MSNVQSVVLITGAARRLGRAMALRLASPERAVAIHYRTSREEAEELAALLGERGVATALVQGDMARRAEAERIVAETITALGRLDVLINNASIYYPTPLPDVAEDDFDAFLDVNLKGPFFAAQAAARHMLARGGGCIVNLVDTLYDRPPADYVPYTMSKAGLAAMTQGMARALGPTVRVVGIAPGPVLLPEHLQYDDEAKVARRLPLRRVGSAEDIAEAAAYLIDQAPYVTGHILRVDGGEHVV